MHDLISSWSGECVVVSFDQPTGTWIFVAIHDTTLGPAMGGCRMKVYDTPDDGLRDAMRLAEGMTHKWATVGFDLGGAKSVLAVPHPMNGKEREGLFLRFGRLINTFRGAYSCGPDLGTTPEDMAVIGRETEFVHGVGRDGSAPIDPGPFTAMGVFSGMRAAIRQVFGSDVFGERTVLIQGAGDVGRPLGLLVAEAGATVLISDTDSAKADRLAGEVGGGVVAPEAVCETECDVYAPCAIGATLNARSIPTLRCRIIAGSANNQLEDREDASRLHERGILYAPDYVINAGGATALPLLGGGKHSHDDVMERVRGFDGILTEIFVESVARNESPLSVAELRVERELESRRESEL